MKLAIAQYIVHVYGLHVDDVTELVKSIDISHVRSEADTFGCGLDLRIIDILSTAGIGTDNMPQDQLIMYKKYGWRSEDAGEIKFEKTEVTGPLIIAFDKWTTLEND